MYRDRTTSPLVVTAFNGYVTALEATTGEIRWQVKLGGGGSVIRLHVDEQLVVALGNIELTAIEYPTGKVLWTVEVPGSSLLVDGRQAFVSNNGVLSAVDLATGKILWTNELAGTGYGVASIGTPVRSSQADTRG